MKKTIFFAVLVFVSFSIKAQIINTNTTQIESASYKIDNNTQSIEHAQKILKYNDKLYIILDRKADTSRFYLVKVDDTTSIRASIPPEFKVNDFSILGDSIYFCGYKLNDTNTLNDGFIAYVAISDMFFTGVNYMYSLIPSTYNVYKVLTYYNETNARIVAAIGGQMYGDFKYSEFPPVIVEPPSSQNPDNSNKLGWSNANGYWSVATPISRDCFISYKVTQTVSSNNTYNVYDIYCSPYTNKYIEMFENFVLTDNYICIVSKYIDTSQQCPPTNTFIFRRIDKNNIANQVSNKCAAANLEQDREAYTSIPLEHLNGDTIAWSYGASSASNYFTAIYKIDLNVSLPSLTFTSVLASQLDINTVAKCLTWDLEYIRERNELLLLKQQSSSLNYLDDFMYYINMKNGTNFPYNTLAFTPIEESWQQQKLKLNSLLKYSLDHCFIVGMQNEISLYDKNIYTFNTQLLCNRLMNIVVDSISEAGFSHFNNLQHCTFADAYHIYWLPANIQTYKFKAGIINIPVRKYCVNKEYDLEFHLN